MAGGPPGGAVGVGYYGPLGEEGGKGEGFGCRLVFRPLFFVEGSVTPAVRRHHTAVKSPFSGERWRSKQ